MYDANLLRAFLFYLTGFICHFPLLAENVSSQFGMPTTFMALDSLIWPTFYILNVYLISSCLRIVLFPRIWNKNKTNLNIFVKTECGVKLLFSELRNKSMCILWLVYTVSILTNLPNTFHPPEGNHHSMSLRSFTAQANEDVAESIPRLYYMKVFVDKTYSFLMDFEVNLRQQDG